MIPEPAFWTLFGGGATLLMERLLRWIWRQEHDPYWRRQRALDALRRMGRA